MRTYSRMRIAIGSDHAGFLLKEELCRWLRQQGHAVTDFGTNSGDSTDYPDFALPVAQSVAAGNVERGILICSTGVGMSIAANKVKGVRAALAVNEDEVALTRAHNDANVLTLGARYTSPEQGKALITVFLETLFEGGRHQRRVSKIASIEETDAKRTPISYE